MPTAAIRGLVVSLVFALWMALVGGATPAAAANPVTSGHVYDISIHVYDTTAISAHAHFDERAPAASQDVDGNAQATAAIATEDFFVLLPLSVAANSLPDAHVVKEWIKPDCIEAVWLIIYASLWFLFYAIGASASGVAS